MSERWIVVPNWEKFQHYKDRNPAWIKLYTELQDKDEWLDLSLRLRGMLCGIWLLYAKSGQQLGASPARLGRMLGESTVRVRDLERLESAGFITFSASKPLAQIKSKRQRKRSAFTSREDQPVDNSADNGKPTGKPDSLWTTTPTLKEI